LHRFGSTHPTNYQFINQFLLNRLAIVMRVELGKTVAKLWHKIGEKQHRAFLWAVVLCLLIGALNIGEPIDDTLKMVRNRIRPASASGKIVLLMPDKAEHGHESGWSWTRGELADLVRQLHRAGARRVAIDRVIGSRQNQAVPDDLAGALAQMPERSLVGTAFDVDPETGRRGVSPVSEDIGHVAEAGLINQYFNAFGRVPAIPYRLTVRNKSYRGFAAILGSRDGSADEMAPINYAIDLRTIPVLSIATIARDSEAGAIRGKTIIVASSEATMNVFGEGRIPVAYAHALGAETLLRGRPVDLGWSIPFLFGLAAAGAIWFGRRRGAYAALVISTSGGLFGPFWLESQQVFVDCMAGLLLVFAVAGIRLWRSVRRAGERANPLTGLPNLAAFNSLQPDTASAVVAVRIVNYAELVSVVSVSERTLVEQIVGRLNASGGASLFHGDGGLFAWIVPTGQVENLGDQLDALHAFFLKPINVSGWQVDVSIAFGVDMSGSSDLAARFACALIAADEAAERGHRWKFYDSARLDEAEWNVSLLGKLEAAIHSGEVWVAYQPKVDVANRSVAGFEALVRWSHPERGAISPEQFVSVAEDHGRIDALTYFVLNDALALLKGLGPQRARLGVAVNLSVRMFERADFVANVRAALFQHGVEPGRLTFEITESAAATNEAEMLATIAQLAKLGTKISIDDYGTGYSTLDYLKKLGAAELKIDRGFVSGMERNRSDFMLVKATVDLAHSLGHSVVAEGVETSATLEMLRSLGCDIAQGYLIARPMPKAEIKNFLQSAPRRRAA
jgi:EAL domain-containing protein (putative c-di-GMP-specific phosphodiesterase class I)